ncbi:MAG: class I SAM-dependent methyltransferase [Verrucomicrobiota bacterium]
MKRIVKPELLDDLPPADSRAIQSRRDLQRLNFFMGSVGIVERKLDGIFPNEPPQKIVDIGAGDGTFMLQLAKRFSNRWRNVEVVLVDQQDIVSPDTKEKYSQLGWGAKIISADVFDWLSRCEDVDCILTNLFLHHFESEKLSRLLQLVSIKTKIFLACEPRRSFAGTIGTKLVWLIGCNSVTRHDAPVSVRAGFRDKEISELWPGNGNWEIEEGRAGVFSQAFVAARL